MARPLHLPTLSLQNYLSFLPLPPPTFFFLVIAVFSTISLVSFLCASHRIRKPHKLVKEETAAKRKLVPSLHGSLSGKALLMVKMISWRKVEGEELDYEGEDEAIWRKTIMMGERCQPLEFSGKILYDSQGNLLPDSPNGKKYAPLVSSGKS